MLDYIFQAVFFVMCTAIPGYKSFQAINSPGQDDDKQWLTYWVVLTLFLNVEPFLFMVTGLIPGYNLIKVAFFYFLGFMGGATWIFDNVIINFLDKNRENIEKAQAALLTKLNEAGINKDELSAKINEMTPDQLKTLFAQDDKKVA